jgi:hypothetical protein
LCPIYIWSPCDSPPHRSQFNDRERSLIDFDNADSLLEGVYVRFSVPNLSILSFIEGFAKDAIIGGQHRNAATF